MLSKLLGGQGSTYHISHKVLICIIILIALYHISKLHIHTSDQVLFFYIVMLEMVGIIYEYYG